MNRKYDLSALASQHGFSIKEMEKVCRISDLLENISAVKFLSDRLSLYGGTAFTFIYTPEILRLSVDLDFNYRHKDEKDWSQVRDEIDIRLKDLLDRLAYTEEDIKINASYPLTRFTVSYENTLGLKDTFKVEMGYLKRSPILKNDIRADFKHLGSQETFKTTTPTKEELFANKWCTLLYRGTPRDLFDVYQIANIEFNHEVFRKCAIFDSLTHQTPKIHNYTVIVANNNTDAKKLFGLEVNKTKSEGYVENPPTIDTQWRGWYQSTTSDANGLVYVTVCEPHSCYVSLSNEFALRDPSSFVVTVEKTSNA